jgi:RIO kinase 1
VHADLSEYNILYHDSHLYIIDVSQSVEHDHPSAFDFLRNDIKNIEEFFGRLGVKCLGLRRCFEFITKDKLADNAVGEDAVLKQWLDEEKVELETSADAKDDATPAALSAHEDSVFLQSYIPRSLNELYDPERDAAAVRRGESGALIYADTIGLVESLSKDDTKEPPKALSNAKVRFENEAVEESASDDSGSGGEESESSDRAERESFEEQKPRGHRHEDREAKKVYLTYILYSPTYHPSVLGTQKSNKSRSQRKTKAQASQG